MHLRVTDRANTRWKHWAVWFAAMAVLVQAQAMPGEGAGVIPADASTSGATISVADAFGILSRLSWWGIDLAMETAGYGTCPFVENPAKAAKEALERRIRAQPLAVEYLSTALSAWHSRQLSGRLEPLVLALTGSTGTGKTETAWVLAEGLLAKRCRISGGTTDIPRGLLVLNGGEYITPARVDDYHQKIRRKVGQRLDFCGGNVVVLFDELQKAAPGTLDALMEAMSEHPTVTYEEGNRSVTVDSGRAIFLLVSDVGAEGINSAVLRYSRRSDIAPGTLESEVKKALDEEWERLRFRKVVDKVIPYLPMDATSNALVVELKLQQLEKTLSGELYTTQGLRWHLVQFGYVQYSTYNVTPSLAGGKETFRRDLAVYGARDVEKVSMRRVTGVLRRHVFLQEACSTVNRAAEGRVGGGAGGAEGQGGDGRCWEEPFAVDIRYDESTNQVSFYRCTPAYAEGLTELQREHPSAVMGPLCELAWRGVLYDHES